MSQRIADLFNAGGSDDNTLQRYLDQDLDEEDTTERSTSTGDESDQSESVVIDQEEIGEWNVD